MPEMSLHEHHLAAHGRRGRYEELRDDPSRWEEVYADRPRWDIGRPQPAFLALAESGAVRGRVLDVGCGTGEHVLMAAALGLDATGVDIADAAIGAATEKARERDLPARFVRLDVARLDELGGTFDTVLDSGLLVHVAGRPDSDAFFTALRAIVAHAGRYFALCFAGPDRDVRERQRLREEITALFGDGWRFDSIEPITLDGLTDPEGIPAWRIALTRT